MKELKLYEVHLKVHKTKRHMGPYIHEDGVKNAKSLGQWSTMASIRYMMRSTWWSNQRKDLKLPSIAIGFFLKRRNTLSSGVIDKTLQFNYIIRAKVTYSIIPKNWDHKQICKKKLLSNQEQEQEQEVTLLQVSVYFIGRQLKGFYTYAQEDCDASNKHLVCKMKRRGSCSGRRDREKECVTLVIATIPSKRGKPPEDPLVFVKLNLTSTSITPLRRFTWLKT